jgi:hypothetical protein
MKFVVISLAAERRVIKCDETLVCNRCFAVEAPRSEVFMVV